MSGSKVQLTLTLVWALLFLPALLWWKESVPFLVFVSVYANFVGHWAAWEAAQAKEEAEAKAKEAEASKDEAEEAKDEAEASLRDERRRGGSAGVRRCPGDRVRLSPLPKEEAQREIACWAPLGG